MSYQYPPPPGADYKHPPETIGNYQIPPGISPESGQQLLDGNLYSQEANQLDEAGNIKRSSSTPNIRGQEAADAALAASAEKRRNKLGYHRTSVACGHCRRRKIRCILAPGDLQNRCANCIRLKKECNFYPVDQPPQPESKAQRAAAGGRGLGRASSSASPTNHPGHPSETHNEPPYPNMNMPPYLGSAELKRQKGDGFVPDHRGLVFGVPNEYPPQSAAWLQSKMPPSTRPVADAASAYWRVNTQEQLINPAFSMFPQPLNSSQSHNWPPAAVEQGSREELNWPVPQRSVSFGNLENLPHQPSYLQYAPSPSESNPQENFVPQCSPPQSKPYVHNIPPDESSSAMDLSGSTNEQISHVSGPRQPPPFSAAQDWQNLPQYAYMKAATAASGEVFTGWYSQDPNITPSPQTVGDGMQTEQYGHVAAYDSMYYGDAPQAGRQL